MSEPGLRERKKAKTRRAIQDAALALIAEQGYEATTVEQIAAAAEVSPSTCFRYFPTKEDIILADEYDPEIFAALVEGGSGPPVEVIRSALAGLFRRIYAADRDVLYQRILLCLEVPSVRSRMHEGINEALQLMTKALATRFGVDPDNFELQMANAAALGVMTRAIERWAERGGTEDLPSQVDAALSLLGRGFAETAG